MLLFGGNVLATALFGLLWYAGHFWTGLGLMFAGHMALLSAVLHPRCQWLGPVHTSIAGREEEIILTFDDGPDEADTPFILEQLRQHGRRGIFFVIGEKARRHPDLIRRIAAEGHALGNHTLTHPQASCWRLGPGALHREISACSEILREITGNTPPFFRPPVGHKSPFLHPVLRRLGLPLVGWTARGFDGVRTNPAEILKRLLPRVKPGGIVLLHEGPRTRQGTPLIRETLPAVLAAAAACEAVKAPA